MILFFGLSFFVWGYHESLFRDTEGFLRGGFCLPVSVGVALIILGWGIAGRLRKPAFWFALAVVGQAVALQMIEVCHYSYQHYFGGLAWAYSDPFDRFMKEIHPLLLVYLAVQTVLVVVGFRTRWPKIRAWMARTFKVWQLSGVGLVFFLSSTTLSRYMSVYISELFFATFVQTVNLGNIVLIAWALPEEVLASLKHRLDKLFGQLDGADTKESGRLDRFAMLAAVWVTTLAVVLSVFSYERYPHIGDELDYLYHARYFADGMLTMPAPPVPEAFHIDLMDYEEDRWYSPVPPGWPAMLALGVIFGVPWLVNPVLAGLNVLLIYIFMQEIYDRRTARMALLLLCFSPWYVFMAMNFINHTFTLTCALAAALGVAKARRTGRALWGWIGGIATGIVSLTRPLDGAVIMILLGLWAIGIGGKRLKISAITGLVLGSIIVGSVVLPYNKHLTGDPFTFPIMAYCDKYWRHGSNDLGFGPDRGLGWPNVDPFPGHGPIDVLINANFNIFSVNIELFGWSTGSLILIAIILFSGGIRRGDYLMLAIIGGVVGIHSFYWFSGGPDFGARYWYLIILPCAVLTVQGIHFLIDRFQAHHLNANNPTRIIVAVLSLCLLSFVNFFPWRAIDKYHHYRSWRPGIRHLAEEYNFGKSLVLIRGDRVKDYTPATLYNPLNLHADQPVYVYDKNSEVRHRVLKAYPDRPIWIINGPSITHEGYKVVGGPFAATELLYQE